MNLIGKLQLLLHTHTHTQTMTRAQRISQSFFSNKDNPRHRGHWEIHFSIVIVILHNNKIII